MMQCFNDSGHKNAAGGQHWNEKVCAAHRSYDSLWIRTSSFVQVKAVLVGPGHQMMLFKPNGTGHSDWLEMSQWYVGDQYKDDVDSISIDYLFD